MWRTTTLFHWAKSIEKNIEKRYIVTQSIDKSFSTAQNILKKNIENRKILTQLTEAKLFDRSSEHNNALQHTITR